ncbi:hypothetical protein D6779_03040, partial [Candidatus Parcubacteria bacterium]
MGALPLVGMVSAERGRKRYGLLVGLVLAGMLLAACGLGGGGGNPPTDTPTPSPTFCPQTTTPQSSATPTQAPTATATLGPNAIYSSVPLYQLASYLYTRGVSECAPEKQNSSECLAKTTEWQNKYNEMILQTAFHPQHIKIPTSVDPVLLSAIYKRVVMNETQFIPGAVTGTEQGSGLAQVTPDTLRTLYWKGFVKMPEGYTKNDLRDDNKLISLLKEPAFSMEVGMANLVYLYQGIQKSNTENGWQMSEEDIWRLAAAYYNARPQSPNIFATPDPQGHDFWEANRRVIQDDPSWYATYGCNDPAAWDCLKYTFPNKDAYGRCTILYAESVVPSGISENPVSSEV